MEEDKEHIEKPVKKKKRKWLRHMIYLFLVISILFDAFLYFFATPVLKDYLQGKIHDKTKGLYHIEFDKISVELGTRNISLKNFKLIPDTLVYNKLLKKGEAKSAIYQISTSSIELWGTSFFKLFFKRHFKAKELIIRNPVVDLKKLPSKNGKVDGNRDFIHEDLFPSIEKHFDQLELKYIKLENGKFHLSLNKDSVHNTSHYGFISISLDRFLLNKKEFEQKSRLFYADDIQFAIEDYRLKLGDGIHAMFADSLFISTKESLLKINSFGIKPDIELPQYLSLLKSNYYYISTPEIKFRNFNISQLYFNQDIEIQNIIVESPKIKLINKLVEKKTFSKKEAKEIDFYKLLKNKLKSISISTLDLKQANFSLHYNSHIEEPSYQVNNFNLNLFNFYLDKDSKNDQSRILYSKNIRLNIDEFKTNIKNNTHELSTGKINLHTDTRSLFVDNILIRPIKNKKAKSQITNIKLNNLDIKGADFYKFYHEKVLRLDRLSSNGSTVNISLYKSKGKKQKKQKKVLSTIIGKFIKTLDIRNIDLNKAKFKISSYLKDSLLNRFEGKVNLKLKRFHLANTGGIKNSKAFHSEKFKLELSNYSQYLNDQLHILKVNEVYLSNTDSLVRLSKLSITPRIGLHKQLSSYNKSKLIELHVKNSALKGIDISKAYENKELTVNKISISRPSLKLLNFIDINIKVDSSYNQDQTEDTSVNDSLVTDSLLQKNTVVALLSDYFSKINIKTFSLKKGAFSFIDVDSLDKKDLIMKGKLSVTAENFDYDYESDIESYGFANSEHFDLTLDDFYRKVSSNHYLLKIKKAKLSAKDSLFSADIIRFFPNPKMHDSLYGNLIWTFYSPKLETKGLNITAFLNENILDLGAIKLKNPSIAIISKTGKKKTNKENTNIKKGKSHFPFEKIIIDSLDIENGAIGILNDTFNLSKQIFNTKFNIQLSEFQVNSNTIKNPIETIKQINTIVELQKFRYLLSKNNYILDIDKFYLNSENGVVQIDSINYFYKNFNTTVSKKENSKLEALQIPAIKFSAFSFKDLLDKKLVSDSISISKPYVQFTSSNTESTKSKNPLEINLFDKTKNILKAINLKHIKFDEASFSLSNKKNGNLVTNEFNKIHGSISDLLIDSLHQNDTDKLFNASDIAFGLNDYELYTKNELYKIKIKELGFSTGLKKVYANLISMNPTVERDVLAKKATKEIKLIYFNVNNLIANNFDFKSFLSDKKIISEHISINNLKLHSYKNKHFPLDSFLKIALPIDYMLNAKNYIKIDTVDINNSYIGVELLGTNSTETGYFDITQLNATVTGISNDKDLINNGLIMKIKAHGLIMDQGLLTASFRFPLNSKYGEYFYGGKLNSMEMKSYNPLLENLFFVSIREGLIDSMNFNISANEDYAEGKMKFSYNNLKFDIRNKKKSDSLIIARRGLASLAANSVIKDNNPRRKNGRIKEGRIYYERDVYHPIFHYWTMSTLSGIQSTMGFKSKQLKERLKLEKLTKKYNKSSAKKKSKIKRKEKKKIQKEINEELVKKESIK